VNKSFHPSTNPEILVKIGPLDSVLPGQKVDHEKKLKKNKEKTLAKYIDLPASLLSGLKT